MKNNDFSLVVDIQGEIRNMEVVICCIAMPWPAKCNGPPMPPQSEFERDRQSWVGPEPAQIVSAGGVQEKVQLSKGGQIVFSL